MVDFIDSVQPVQPVQPKMKVFNKKCVYHACNKCCTRGVYKNIKSDFFSKYVGQVGQWLVSYDLSALFGVQLAQVFSENRLDKVGQVGQSIEFYLLEIEQFEEFGRFDPLRISFIVPLRGGKSKFLSADFL